MNIKIWISNAWTKVKENLPGVVRNYPFSSAVLFIAGMVFLVGIQVLF